MDSLRPRGVIEYFEIFWRKKFLIFLIAGSVLIATLLIIRRVPNLYESRSSLVISNQGPGAGGGNDGILLSTPTLAALTQQLTSHGNLMAIVRRYNLYPPAPGQKPDPDSAIERLGKAIKIDIKMRNYYPDAPEALTISYRYTDPTIAQRVVTDLVSIFEQTNIMTRNQAATELERFRGKITDVETQLHALAPQRDLAILRSEAARYYNNDSSGVRAQRLTTANTIDSLSDKEFMLERQADEQRRQINEQEKLVKSASPSAALAGNSAYGVLLARRAEVDGQIKDLSTYATDKNPKMVQARSQLASVNREIARLESASGANLGETLNSATPEGRELRAMKRDLQRIETELEVTKRDLGRKTQSLNSLPKTSAAEIGNTDRLPSLQSGQINEGKAEYDRLMGRYTWLISKQDTLQILSGDDGKKINLFQVIDPPIVQPTPVGPNRMTLKLIGLGIALALGLLIAAAREAPRLFLINNDRDVEYYLGAPVLASIPETLTASERSRRRRLLGLRWLGVCALAVGMIPVFVIALDRIQIFQILGSR